VVIQCPKNMFLFSTITVQHSSAMSVKYRKWRLGGPVTPKPLNRFSKNLASVITSPTRPHTQNLVTISFKKHGCACTKFAVRCLFLRAKAATALTRLSHCNSVCQSVHPSHGCISQKRHKLGSPNLHHRLPGRP